MGKVKEKVEVPLTMGDKEITAEMLYPFVVEIAESGLYESIIAPIVKPVENSVKEEVVIAKPSKNPVKDKVKKTVAKKEKKKKDPSEKISYIWGNASLAEKEGWSFWIREEKTANAILKNLKEDLMSRDPKTHFEKIAKFFMTDEVWSQKETFTRKELQVAVDEAFPEEAEYTGHFRLYMDDLAFGIWKKKGETVSLKQPAIFRRSGRGQYENGLRGI